MNRLLLTVVLFLTLILPQAWGAGTQYPNPYRPTVWNNLTDGLHTLGPSPQQAKYTKFRLHKARARARIRSINQAKDQAWLNSKH